MTLIIASIAGSAGAAFRYLVSGWVQGRSRVEFPVGTLAVNATGSLLLGVLAGAGNAESTLVLAGIGFLGGFTTFSTWMVETIRLGVASSRALVNLLVALIAGVALAAFGYILAS